jgi:hypothetical protein
LKGAVLARLSSNNKSFIKKFGTEGLCFERLVGFRWPVGFICPECFSKDHYTLRKRHMFRCKDCKSEVSVKSGTFLHHTHLCLKDLVLAFYLSTVEPGPISPSLFLESGVTNRFATAHSLCFGIRSLMQRAEVKLLKGHVQVEHTQTELIKPDGRTQVKVDIVGSIEHLGTIKVISNDEDQELIGRIRLAFLPSVYHENINSFCNANLEARCLILANNSKAFSKIEETGFNFIPQFVDRYKTIDRYIPEICEVLETVSKWLPSKTKFRDLEGHLDEYVFRHNHGYNPEVAFNKLLKTALMKYPKNSNGWLTRPRSHST